MSTPSSTVTPSVPFPPPPPPPPPPWWMSNSSGPGSFGSMGQPPGAPSAASHYKAGVVELTALQPVSYTPAPVPCNGTNAVVVAKPAAATANVAGNGACPSEWGNSSCSCLPISGSTSEWTFQLTKQTAAATTVIPATIDPATTTLAVTTIGRFALPDHVTSLRLLGVMTTNEPLTLGFDLTSPFDQAGPSVSLVESESANYIKQVEVANIDLASVDITEDFLPSSVTTLTLRNCKLTTLPTAYLTKRWDKLLNVDLSDNKLSAWSGGEMNAAPPDGTAAITTLNLSGNAFTKLPSSLLAMTALQNLNFSNNPVTNWTINDALYTKIASLESFVFPNSSSVLVNGCGVGASVKTAHDISFCVLAASAAPGAPVAPSTTSGDSSSHSTLKYVAIVGAVVVVALAAVLVVLYRRRKGQARGKAFSRTFDNDNVASAQERGYASVPSNQAFQTLSLSQGDHAMHTPLLNDPMIITSRLDRKDILLAEMLKQGGFGVVYSGVYKRRRVVVKMLRSEFSKDNKLIESFIKEIALMASLKHPRIVEYIGCAWDTIQNLAMVAELMERGDLHETLQYFKQRNTPLTWPSHKMQLALHIAEGLQYLHTLSPKVIHRDLKATNVLVNSDLEAKLTDFGISREGRFEQTHMTAGIGTSFWIAPEVLAGLRYDERADIFSFGVVLSEIDTDDYPYWNDQEGNGEPQGYTQQDAILRKVLRGEMRPKFTPDCPPRIRFLAEKCLEGEPSKRPSASEIVLYLAPIAYPVEPDVPLI